MSELPSKKLSEYEKYKELKDKYEKKHGKTYDIENPEETEDPNIIWYKREGVLKQWWDLRTDHPTSTNAKRVKEKIESEPGYLSRYVARHLDESGFPEKDKQEILKKIEEKKQERDEEWRSLVNVEDPQEKMQEVQRMIEEWPEFVFSRISELHLNQNKEGQILVRIAQEDPNLLVHFSDTFDLSNYDQREKVLKILSDKTPVYFVNKIDEFNLEQEELNDLIFKTITDSPLSYFYNYYSLLEQSSLSKNKVKEWASRAKEKLKEKEKNWGDEETISKLRKLDADLELPAELANEVFELRKKAVLNLAQEVKQSVIDEAVKEEEEKNGVNFSEYLENETEDRIIEKIRKKYNNYLKEKYKVSGELTEFELNKSEKATILLMSALENKKSAQIAWKLGLDGTQKQKRDEDQKARVYEIMSDSCKKTALSAISDLPVGHIEETPISIFSNMRFSVDTEHDKRTLLQIIEKLEQKAEDIDDITRKEGYPREVIFLLDKESDDDLQNIVLSKLIEDQGVEIIDQIDIHGDADLVDAGALSNEIKERYLDHVIDSKPEHFHFHYPYFKLNEKEKNRSYVESLVQQDDLFYSDFKNPGFLKFLLDEKNRLVQLLKEMDQQERRDRIKLLEDKKDEFGIKTFKEMLNRVSSRNLVDFNESFFDVFNKVFNNYPELYKDMKGLSYTDGSLKNVYLFSKLEPKGLDSYVEKYKSYKKSLVEDFKKEKANRRKKEYKSDNPEVERVDRDLNRKLRNRKINLLEEVYLDMNTNFSIQEIEEQIRLREILEEKYDKYISNGATLKFIINDEHPSKALEYYKKNTKLKDTLLSGKIGTARKVLEGSDKQFSDIDADRMFLDLIKKGETESLDFIVEKLEGQTKKYQRRLRADFPDYISEELYRIYKDIYELDEEERLESDRLQSVSDMGIDLSYDPETIRSELIKKMREIKHKLIRDKRPQVLLNSNYKENELLKAIALDCFQIPDSDFKIRGNLEILGSKIESYQKYIENNEMKDVSQEYPESEVMEITKRGIEDPESLEHFAFNSNSIPLLKEYLDNFREVTEKRGEQVFQKSIDNILDFINDKIKELEQKLSNHEKEKPQHVFEQHIRPGIQAKIDALRRLEETTQNLEYEEFVAGDFAQSQKLLSGIDKIKRESINFKKLSSEIRKLLLLSLKESNPNQFEDYSLVKSVKFNRLQDEEGENSVEVDEIEQLITTKEKEGGDREVVVDKEQDISNETKKVIIEGGFEQIRSCI